MKLIKFWADWCVHCHKTEPIRSELEVEFGDRVEFLRVDMDELFDLPRRYRVTRIPTILLVDDLGDVVANLSPWGQQGGAGFTRDEHFRILNVRPGHTPVVPAARSHGKAPRHHAGGPFLCLGRTFVSAVTSCCRDGSTRTTRSSIVGASCQSVDATTTIGRRIASSSEARGFGNRSSALGWSAHMAKPSLVIAAALSSPCLSTSFSAR
jgi:hypothetical protein